MVTALENFIRVPVFDRAKLLPLNGTLRDCVAATPGCELVSPRAGALANTVSFVVERADGIALMAGCDVEGICASSGSACSAGSLEPSHVISAIGRPERANAMVRFSLGRDSTLAEVAAVCHLLPEIIRRAQL